MHLTEYYGRTICVDYVKSDTLNVVKNSSFKINWYCGLEFYPNFSYFFLHWGKRNVLTLADEIGLSYNLEWSKEESGYQIFLSMMF